MTRQRSIHARFDIERDGFALQVALDLPGQGVTAIFGESGSGKTTLLRAIAGLERHAGAYLRVNGEVWQDEARGVFVPPHRRALGYVFQEASLFAHLTVAGNLEYARRRASPALGDKEAAEIVDLLGIGHLLGRGTQFLSGGERQRVAIARALLTNPALLLMDEPLASLDRRRKEEVLPYLERLHRESALPLLYVSHSMDEVARLADHLVLLDAGKAIADGPLFDILARLDLPTALGEDAGVVIEGTADGFDEAYQLVRLRAAGNILHAPHAALAPGTRLRLRILARDVSLSSARQSGTSILNHLPAVVTQVRPAGHPAQVLVALDAGGTVILARLTRRSCDELELRPGKQVWAQIKAVALLPMAA